MIGHFDRLIHQAREGQATAEYIIIVALVAVACIAVVTFFGDQIRNLFSQSTSRLAGTEDDSYQDTSDTNAQGAQSAKQKTLADF